MVLKGKNTELCFQCEIQSHGIWFNNMKQHIHSIPKVAGTGIWPSLQDKCSSIHSLVDCF